jgi:penicillin amidase
VRLIRVLVVLLATALVVAIVAVIAIPAAITSRGLPQTTGTITPDGLHAPATILRDRAGIAHVYADDPHDLFLAQGYVHAQERMWQMEVWRHISSGRLAELFGPSEVDTDRFIRTLGWRAAAERDLAVASPELREILQAQPRGGERLSRRPR